MAQKEMLLAANPADVSSIPEFDHMVEGESWLSHVVL